MTDFGIVLIVLGVLTLCGIIIDIYYTLKLKQIAMNKELVEAMKKQQDIDKIFKPK